MRSHSFIMEKMFRSGTHACNDLNPEEREAAIGGSYELELAKGRSYTNIYFAKFAQFQIRIAKKFKTGFLKLKIICALF